ncbi:MAG TPA: helix-turn-helix domain-containing protein [Stellaceae bacterium]|nr:helix-turn-helix domain-containing protein [Stellaceae bacterium]
MKSKTRSYDMSTRAAQAEATRARIREAAVALYIEASLDGFTLDEVARRAAVTVQTVLRAFKSKDQLVLAAMGVLATHGRAMKTPAMPGDIAGAVAVIFDLYETIGDLVLQQLVDEHRLPALKPEMDLGRKGHADWVTAAFAPQLRGRSGKARTQLFNALMVATDIYVWKLLRRDQQLERPQAEAVVRHLITGITRET